MNIAAMCWPCPWCGKTAVLAGVSMAGRPWRECLACGWMTTVGEHHAVRG